MKRDARQLLNRKKGRNTSGIHKADTWKKHSSSVDARKILNSKRSQKPKPPVLGSYMRTKSATALIAEQIKKEISATTKVPNKRVQLSRDGNIIVTSKSRNNPQAIGRREAVPKKSNNDSLSKNRAFRLQNSRQFEPSTSMDDLEDLEHTAIEDLLDLESLPPSYVPSKSLQSADLSRKSVMNQILGKKHTMVADEVSEYNVTVNTVNRVYVSNLHPTVSRHDVMELFSDIGVIKGIEMLKPGTAIIEFFDDDDAVKACEIYHNRLLDGLPMKCYLHSGSSPQKISQRLGSRREPSIQSTNRAVSPTMFNPRSRYNPRNVQFTVKLT